MITRRNIVCLIGASSLLPLPAVAQRSAKMPRIGVLLTLHSPSEAAPQAFNEGLRSHGYIEGKTIAIEWRAAGGDYDRLGPLAAELVQSKVDIVVADVTPAARAARQASTSIPIIILVAADPVRDGLVASLAHPGGNITGLSILLPDISAKRLQQLHQTIPAVTRVAIFWNPRTPYHKVLLKEVEAAAAKLRLNVLPIAVHGPGDLENAFSQLKKGMAGALYVADDPMFVTSRSRVVELAARDRLPTIFAHSEFVSSGGLMSYGPNLAETFRYAAVYVDKILKGRKPSELPVEQAARLEFAINLKTAKALGIVVPHEIMLSATRLIE